MACRTLTSSNGAAVVFMTSGVQPPPGLTISSNPAACTIGGLARGDVADAVDLAGDQRVDARHRIRDADRHDAVEIGLAVLEVVVVPHVGIALAGHPLGQLERPGADEVLDRPRARWRRS